MRMPPKRYEPEPGEAYWYVIDKAIGLGLARSLISRLALATKIWNDDADDYMQLASHTLYRTRDEAKAELFRRQGEGK